MTDTLVRGEDPVAGERPESARSKRAGWAQPIALIAGLIAALCAVAVPLLPVKVDHTTLSWPQQDSARSIAAPLVSYAPLTFDATVPGHALAQLSRHGGVAMATMPATAPDLDKYGLVARVSPAADGKPAQLDVVLRDHNLLSVPVKGLTNDTLTVHADTSSATVTLAGSDLKPAVLQGDFRPQLVGIFSDLHNPDGTTATAQVDSRFSVTPTLLKRTASVLAVLGALIALVALYRLDAFDGRRLRLIPQRWRGFRAVDGVVLAVLVIWHFIGSTTSDDGYQFVMSRASLVSGYMANYFAYFGVPETPVGTPTYDLLARMSELSTASPWMRLPTLLAGVLCWLLISREVIPRLGVAVRHNRVAVWTGALGFLSVWMPFNNGLRPEPVVAVAVMLTWVFVERSIATRRMLPYALAIMVAGFAFTANPSAAICLAPLLAGARSVWRFGNVRARQLAETDGKPSWWGWIRAYGALLAPLAAAGALVLAVSMSVQPLAATLEAARIHKIVGPDVPWYNEYIHYQWLFMPTADGSIARRFGDVAMWLGLLVSAFMLLRKGGRIPGVASGPAKRLLGITFGAILLIAFSPTKFTHHDGVYAGLAGAIAVLAAVSVGPKVLRAPRYRALFAAIVALVLAQVFTSVNQWWYVSSYGIPWWDKPPSVHGFHLYLPFFGLAILLGLLALWWHLRTPDPGTPHRLSPQVWRLAKIPVLTLAMLLVVAFELGSFAKAAVTQYPAFSLARSNTDAVLGKTCGLANDVLVEKDPNQSLMTPLTGTQMSTFGSAATGFLPNGVGDLTPDDEKSGAASNSSIANSMSGKSSNEGGTQTAGAALPFGLNSATTPELGSYGQTGQTQLTTGWYHLPESGDRSGIIAIAAAGRIRSIDKDGLMSGGEPFEIEYGSTDSATAAHPMGRVTPIDIGPTPAWRNLRVPLSDIPAQANVVRIVASTNSMDPNEWIALTPPRIPQTQTLEQVVGKSPTLLDWAVGLQFPCQRPFDHKDGIAQIPTWRIMPDRGAAHDTTLWSSHTNGGALGWSQELLSSQTMATYLKDDWRQDWGSLERLSPLDPSAVPVQPWDRGGPLTVTQDTRGGMWNPGQIITGW